MAPKETFPVRIIREPYVYGGRTIPLGTIVKVTEAQFAAMNRRNPPYAERVEVAAGATTIAEAGEELVAPKREPEPKAQKPKRAAK